jgi:hypothetical protein
MTDTIQVGPTAVATLVVAAGDGPTLVTNNGPSIVFFGDDNAIRATDSNGIIAVSVNGYFSVSGTKDLYACVAVGGTAQLATLTGGQNFFAPTNLSLLGGAAVYVQATQPTGTIPLNSIWLNTTLGAFETWNGTTWVIQAFTGSELITAGTIAANLLVANIVVAGIVNGTLIQGAELLAGTSPNTQVAITASSGVGLINFIPNNAQFTAAAINSVVSTFAQLLIGSGANVAAGHTDGVILELNSSDGTGSANGVHAYVDKSAVAHFPAHWDASGFNIEYGLVNGLEPGTGTVTVTAVPEVPHSATMINGWAGSGGGPNGLWYWIDAEGELRLIGDIINAAAVGNSIIFNLPSGYIPQTTQNLPAGWNDPAVNNSASVPWVNVAAGTGAVQMTGIEVANKEIFFNLKIPMVAL